MNSYLNAAGREIKAGALTLTGNLNTEMEPVDRVSTEEMPGVWTAGGEVFFSYNGRDYYQGFSAAWFFDGSVDYWDDETGLTLCDYAAGEDRAVTVAEMAEIDKAAGGAAALYRGILRAQRAAVNAAKADALAFLKECIKEGEA